GALLDLGLALADQLAHLLGHERGVAVALAAQASRDGTEDRRALVERSAAPALETLEGAGEAAPDLGRGMLLDGANQLTGGGVDDLHGAPAVYAHERTAKRRAREGGAMSEVQRIEEQLKRAFEGEAWHGPSVRECLADVTAAQAAEHPIPAAHSIWEIVL